MLSKSAKMRRLSDTDQVASIQDSSICASHKISRLLELFVVLVKIKMPSIQEMLHIFYISGFNVHVFFINSQKSWVPSSLSPTAVKHISVQHLKDWDCIFTYPCFLQILQKQKEILGKYPCFLQIKFCFHQGKNWSCIFTNPCFFQISQTLLPSTSTH